MDSSTMKWVGLGGCVLMALGVFLPWLSMGGFGSISGFQLTQAGDILLTISMYLLLAGGIGGAVLCFMENPMAIAAVGAAMGVLLINIVRMVTNGGLPNGFGFYITVVGGIAAIVGCLQMQKK